MNRHARRAEAARAGLGHGPVLFQSLDRLVALATLRASQWLYDGRVLPGVQARINACRYLYAITPEISARLSFSDIHGDIDMAAIDAPFLLEGRG